MFKEIKTGFLSSIGILLIFGCNPTPNEQVLVGDKTSFVFDAKTQALDLYVIKDEAGNSDTIPAHENTNTDYFVVLDDQEISFNPEKIEANDGLQFYYSDSLFEATISWKMAFDDAAIIELSVTPKVFCSKLAIGINALQIDPQSIEDVYCVPHSLPYFRSKEANAIPSGWIDNGGTRNNTFSLLTKKATLSVSVLPSDYRLDNELNHGAINDYAISFDGSEINSVQDKHTLNVQDYSGQIRVAANYPFEVREGKTIVKLFMIHVSRNTNEYATGKHIGQYTATVSYKKVSNANDLYLKSMDFLQNNKGCFNQSGQHSSNYWGSVHSGTGLPFGNGTAYYAMYGNSFSITALNQFKALNLLNKEGETRLNAVTKFLTKSPIQNIDGSFWSMLLLLNDQVKYSDQAYSERVWTHATAWITYYMLQAYQLSGDKEILAAAKKALSWLINQQAEDGSFPKYYENEVASTDKQGDAGWNALAFFKAAEIGLSIDETCSTQGFVKKGIKAVDWICEHQLPQKQFYGSFEDVGGVVDCYASTICARASLKAFELSQDTKYLDAGRSMLSASLAWVTCDYNTLNSDAEAHSWDKQGHWQPAYAHIESTSCYYPCSYTLPMLYLAATEYAAFVSGNEQLYWIKIAQNMSHLSAYFNQNPKSESINGMEWRMFPFLVFTEWGNAQTCYSIIESLKNRVSLSIPKIKFKPDFSSEIDGANYKTIMAIGNDPICKTNANVDYLTFVGSSDNGVLIALLNEGENTELMLKMNEAFILSHFEKTNEIKLSDHITNEEIGILTPKQLVEGIKIDFEYSVLLELRRNK